MREKLETGWTPGPWEVGDDDGMAGCSFVPVTTADGIYLAEVTGDSCEPSEITERDRANARLIAVAPDLFEALKEAETVLARLDTLGGDFPALRRTRAALLRARPQS